MPQSRPPLRRVTSRLAMHQRLLRYLIEPYLRSASARSFDSRTANIIDVLISQQTRDIETVQHALGAEGVSQERRTA